MMLKLLNDFYSAFALKHEQIYVRSRSHLNHLITLIENLAKRCHCKDEQFGRFARAEEIDKTSHQSLIEKDFKLGALSVPDAISETVEDLTNNLSDSI